MAINHYPAGTEISNKQGSTQRGWGGGGETGAVAPP